MLEPTNYETDYSVIFEMNCTLATLSFVIQQNRVTLKL